MAINPKRLVPVNVGRVPGNYVGCNLGDDATPVPPNSETSYVSL